MYLEYFTKCISLVRYYFIILLIKMMNNEKTYIGSAEEIIKEQWDQGHFYSVLPEIRKQTEIVDNKPIFNNIDYNEQSHEEILDSLQEELSDYNFPIPGIEKETNQNIIINNCAKNRDLNLRKNIFNYYQINNAFEWMDGRMLFYFIKTHKPKKIIEIGSGWSTLVMHNTIKQFNLDTKIICIEPYPLPWLLSMQKEGIIELQATILQDTNIELFKQLDKNDICFIDSSHVVKHDSDCLYYINKIFPILKKGVLVHIHDIFLPYEYPESWYKEGRFWNEQYFVYAFLMNNNKFKIKFANTYATKFPKLLEIQKDSYEFKVIKGLDKTKAFGGGSLWLHVEQD